MTDHKDVKTVFVIMPFSFTPTRHQDDLTAFFQTNIKARIEGETRLKHRYVVSRSADQFLINENIISSLYESDVLLCDLSGERANPNVMFELGVRLAVSNKPVIMFREDNPSNQPIFDVSTYYIYSYSPLRYRELEEFLISKLQRYEEGQEVFQSPVLKTLEHAPSVIRRIREGDTFRRFRMLADGLQTATSRFGGDIHMFLKARVPDDIAYDASALCDYLVKNREELAKLDWPSFVIQPVRVPALEAYLVDPLIAGFLPAEVEADFTIYAQCFFDSVLNFGRSYNTNGMPHVILMLRELRLFREMVMQLIGYLLYQPPGNQRFIENFYHYFAQTRVREDVERLKGVTVMHDPNRQEVEQEDAGDALPARP